MCENCFIPIREDLRTMSHLLYRHITLPIVDFIKKSSMLELSKRLIISQWNSREELQNHQFSQLRKLLNHAYDNVPYYTKLFDRVGFDCQQFNQTEDLRKIPVLTKDLVKKNFDQLQAKNIQEFAPRMKHTGGSTGKALDYYMDKFSHSCAWASNWRTFVNNGFQLGEPIADVSGTAPSKTDIKKKIYQRLLNVKQLPASPMSNDVMVSHINYLQKKRHVKTLYGYPSVIYLFARYIINNKVFNLGIQGVYTTSEKLYPHQRKTIEKAFGSEVFDIYGNNESTFYAFECERHDGWHYAMELAYPEVLDQNLHPVHEGEQGRFIATSLTNYAMPFIRYDTGDLGALVSDPCACGRGLARIKHLVGRSRDFIQTPGGKKIHGSFINEILYSPDLPWIERCFIRQKQVDAIQLRICTETQPKDEDIQLLRKRLQNTLGTELSYDIIIDSDPAVTPIGKQKVVESSLMTDEGM